MRRSTRSAAVTAAAGLLGLVLTGCGAGQDAQTSLTLPSVPGVNLDAADGSILIRNAYLVFDADGYPVAGEAPIQVWIYNTTSRPVRLTGLASPQGAESVETDGAVVIPPGGFVHPTLQAAGLRRSLNGTSTLPLHLTFDNGVELAMEVPMAPPLADQPRTPAVADDH
jgi:hypothetical protein